jgi:hypothetical protein
MKGVWNWSRIAGTVLHVLVGGLMIFACSGKAFGFAPPQVVSSLNEAGLGDYIRLIGAGGLVSAILLLVPRTAPLGALAVSAYWGGAICLHMARHESYVLVSVLLLLTWAGAVLRRPEVYLGVSSEGLVRREQDLDAVLSA